MKKIKLLLFALTLTFLANTVVLADTKWDTTRNTYGSTTEGIPTPQYDKENNKIIYTIPEDYNGEEIYFNIVDDINTILGGTYLPGSSASFTIEIVNKSKYKYHYLENSLTIDTMEFNSEYSNDYASTGDSIWYSYTTAAGEQGKYIKGSKAFDGEIIPAYFSINRTSNAALMNLLMTSENYKREKTKYGYKQVYYYAEDKYCSMASNADSRHQACQAILTDEVIGKELNARGYNGIEELDKYYLDFYNNYFNTSATTLDELPDQAIYGKSKTLNGTYYYGGILDGKRYEIRETNATVNSFGYNWFYNECLYLSPNYDVAGNKIGETETLTGEYTIGNYMRHENDVFENILRTDFANIENTDENNTNTLTPFEMYIDFGKTSNAFMSMNFGYMMSFKLAADKGSLVVNYVDSEDNKLADEITSTDMVGNEYETVKKDFAGYKLINVEGETTGKYIDGTIHVTYIYDRITGSLIVNYLDSDENKLTEEIITKGNVGDTYTTEKKNFDGYTFITVDGEIEGTYIDGVLYVTYYYDKYTGTGNIEPPQTGLDLSSLTHSTVTTELYRKEEE